MEIAHKNGTAFREIPMKEEYGLSMLLASGFLQGCAAKHESGRWGLHQWLLFCGGVCKQNRPFKKQEPLPHKFEWIEMEIAKNREEFGLIKTDLSKQKIGDKKS